MSKDFNFSPDAVSALMAPRSGAQSLRAIASNDTDDALSAYRRGELAPGNTNAPPSRWGMPLPIRRDDDAARSSAGPAQQRAKSFVLQIEDGGDPLVCADVRGFREAALAALDPRVAAPTRLVLVAPETDACVWLEGWAEDTTRVRRTVTIRRQFDGKEITAIATLCSYGYGIETSLAVESICAPKSRGSVILRSGVHAKADVEAALARYDAELRAREAALALEAKADGPSKGSPDA